MEKFLEKKMTIPIIIIFIMTISFFVRWHNFDEWLYFKMDQARDAFTISSAVLNGAGELPLLGARAGATEVTYGFLNLGPIFYYFQYFSGVIFDSISPEVFAYPDLFFSIAVLPLLYFFCRLYFQKSLSLAVVILYSFSFLVIQYSRFAWNPNSLPFFTILSFLALLKFLHPQEEKHKKWWLVLWSAGLAIGSQLHFVGFFSLVGVSGLLIAYHFKLWSKEKIKNIFSKKIFLKISFHAGLALLVFLFYYTPVIISDVMKNGENAKNFVEAISSKPSDKSTLEKITKNISQQVRYQTLVATSYIYPKKINFFNSLPMIFTTLVFLAGMYLAILNIKRTTESSRKNFLMLILFWFLVYFILCIPLAYSIRPRFFIFTFAIPFIFLGLVFEFLKNLKSKFSSVGVLVLFILVLLFNVAGTKAWFGEQKESQEKNFSVKRTLILKNKDGVTLGQMRRSADYVYSQKIADSRIYFYVKNELIRPFNYLFFEKRDSDFQYFRFRINSDPKAQYFAIVPADYEKEDVVKKLKSDFEEVSRENFGQIAVWEVDFPAREKSQDFEIEEEVGTSGGRLFWRDVFGDKKEGVVEEVEIEEFEEGLDLEENEGE